jgi:hypothetical protein
MFKTEKNLEYSLICGPLIKFLLLKLILRPAQQFEFDMPGLRVPPNFFSHISYREQK